MSSRSHFHTTQCSTIDQICLDQASLAVYKHGADGRFIDVNIMACKQTGYSKAELCSMSLFDIDPSVSRKTFEALWHTMSETGSVEFESVHQKKDGTRFPVSITNNRIEFEGDTISVSFVQDISNQKKTNETLHLTQFCFDHAPMGIFRIEPSNGQILDVNNKACDSLGYTKIELCNMSVFDIDPDFTRQKWDDHIKKLHHGDPTIIESVHQHKTGRIFPVEITINIIDFRGTEYHLAFVTDISDRKSAEKERLNIKTQLLQSQKMEAIGTLAGGIAHDFNNILSGIFGYSQLAEMNIDQPAKAKGHIAQIVNGAQRAAELVQQILTFSRQSEHKKQALSLYFMLKEALKLIRPSIPSTIAIKEKEFSRAVVMCDPTQMHQIIMNLCTNAYQAMRECGGVMTVGLRKINIPGQEDIVALSRAPGTYLRLQVSDTGDGMDAQTIGKIFNPYFTTKEQGKGTGLGLAVVHGIVEEHKGHIRVHSKQGQGTSFYVYLPVLETNPLSINPQKPEDSLARGSETIMVVDDEDSIRSATQSYLEDQGYAIQAFANGEDAWQAFKNRPYQFDFVVTDMTMPDVTGDTLATNIREIRPELPIILWSGYSEAFYADKIKKTGAIKYLQKPIILEDLAKIIRKKLDATIRQ